MNEVQRKVPPEKRCIMGGDLNRYIGLDNDGVSRVHGGKGIRVRNKKEENALDFAVTFYLTILNTFLRKVTTKQILVEVGLVKVKWSRSCTRRPQQD